MSSSYFSNFPQIQYGGQTVPNIALRAKFIDSVLQNKSVFYPYTVKDGEKPEDVAFNYYDSADLVWLVLLFNQVIDPYYDWPMSSRQFTLHVNAKYESVPGAGDGIQNAQSTISYYRMNPTVWYLDTASNGFVSQDTYLLDPSLFPTYVAQSQDPGVVITPDSFAQVTDPESWTPVYAYDDEFQQNEAKRSIKLLDKRYAQQVVNQFQQVMSQ
jgi:hypothetical protein